MSAGPPQGRDIFSPFFLRRWMDFGLTSCRRSLMKRIELMVGRTTGKIRSEVRRPAIFLRCLRCQWLNDGRLWILFVPFWGHGWDGLGLHLCLIQECRVAQLDPWPNAMCDFGRWTTMKECVYTCSKTTCSWLF